MLDLHKKTDSNALKAEKKKSQTKNTDALIRVQHYRGDFDSHKWQCCGSVQI